MIKQLLQCFLRSDSLFEEGGAGGRGQMRKLCDPDKPLILTAKRNSTTDLSFRVRTKLVIDLLKPDDQSVLAANVSINILDSVHRLILRLNSSPKVPFPSTSARTVT